MGKKRLFDAIIGTGLVAVTIISTIGIAQGQKGGTAAKGGSFRIETPERNAKPSDKPMYYRRVVSVLNLNFAELEGLYLEARDKGNVRLKFETVIKAALAAERSSKDERSDDSQKVVEALSFTNNKLAVALQRVFSLSEREAKDAEAVVTAQYKEAEREAARLDK